MRGKRKYDISIKDNHNYMVGGKHNGVIVHNSPETTSGGNALKFAASVRLDIRRIGSNKEAGDSGLPYANKTRIKIVKNKVAPPFKICEFVIDFKMGLQTVVNLFEYLVKTKEIKTKGSWFYYGDENLGQGRPTAFQKFADEYDIDAIYQDILNEDDEEEDEDIESQILELETKRDGIKAKWTIAKDEKKISVRDKLKKKMDKLKKKIKKLKGEG